MLCLRISALALATLLVWSRSPPPLAPVIPDLGAAQTFAVLGASTVTNVNTPGTIVTGDVGVSPGTAIIGFPPGFLVSGALHAGDAAAAAAQSAVGTAYDELVARTCEHNLTGQDLGGMTLTPGIYCFSSSAALTGTLVLDAQNVADALFIFQIGTTLTTATAATVTLINSASLCNVFWQVGSSATLGTNTAFAGNILAQASITLSTGATIAGRALARVGAVMMDTNDVTAPCLPSIPPICPPITLAPMTMPPGTVNVAYGQTMIGSGGTAPYSFTVTAGVLPGGLTLSSEGVLAGTPTTAGPSTVTIRGTDVNGCVATIVYTIVIDPPVCPAITLMPFTLPAGTMNVAYSQTIVGSGGASPYGFSLTAGALPSGVTLTGGGVLAGTPTVAGTSTFTVGATDANGCVTEWSFAFLTIEGIPTLSSWIVGLLVASLTAGAYFRLRRSRRLTPHASSGPRSGRQ